jgi:hypothetical protein
LVGFGVSKGSGVDCGLNTGISYFC